MAASPDLDVVRGTLDLLILRALSWGPMHAFEIISWLEARSDGHLAVADAAFVQSVHRMEERGLVTAQWGTTKNDRQARYYRLTAAGRRQLSKQQSNWDDLVRAIGSVIPTTPPFDAE